MHCFFFLSDLGILPCHPAGEWEQLRISPCAGPCLTYFRPPAMTCQNSFKRPWPGQGRDPLSSCLLSAHPYTGFLIIICSNRSHTACLGKQLQETISNQVTGFWEERKRIIITKNEVEEGKMDQTPAGRIHGIIKSDVSEDPLSSKHLMPGATPRKGILQRQDGQHSFPGTGPYITQITQK